MMQRQQQQCRIKTKLGLMLLPEKGVFFLGILARPTKKSRTTAFDATTFY